MDILKYCDKEETFALFSLFLVADGHATSDEQNLLDKLANEIDISKDIRSKVKAHIDNLQLNDIDNSMLVIQEYEKNYSMQDNNLIHSLFNKSETFRRIHAYTIWNLIHLGYCDTVYSNPEKRVVEYLANKWEISNVLCSEFVDTAETISLLCKHKQWIKNTGTSYDATDAKLKEVDIQIQKLYKNISVTISEMDTIGKEGQS